MSQTHFRANAPRRSVPSYSRLFSPPGGGGEVPRILVVSPEISCVPKSFAPSATSIRAKAGGLADVTCCLVNGLQNLGADVHLALPNYRELFNFRPDQSLIESYVVGDSKRQLHLAEDRTFYYRSKVYDGGDLVLSSIAFQREVINNIIPRVRPDIIHCHDWMAGLIPAFARRCGIPSLFTVHGLHSRKVRLNVLENRGIDAATFWDMLYYERTPINYEETREHNSCDLLASGIFAADQVNFVSPGFLDEVVAGAHEGVPDGIRDTLGRRREEGSARAVINAPACCYNPSEDKALAVRYGAATVMEGKRANKIALQHATGLAVDADAPILFWPSRLDPVQKGCHLFVELLYRLMRDYEERGLQVVSISDGPHFDILRQVIDNCGFGDRVAAKPFDEDLSRLAYAGSDFILMPSLFEPCGLPQMIGLRYGTLPIVRNTGGLGDTVRPLDESGLSGNGFLFDDYSAEAFREAIDRALAFHQTTERNRWQVLTRVLEVDAREFDGENMFSDYLAIYEELLRERVAGPGTGGALPLSRWSGRGHSSASAQIITGFSSGRV